MAKGVFYQAGLVGTLVYAGRKPVAKTETFEDTVSTRTHKGSADAAIVASFASTVLGSAMNATELSPGIYLIDPVQASIPEAPKGRK